MTTTNPYETSPRTKIIKRVIKTIEKYDSEGKLIGKEVIIEEQEDIEQEVWEPCWKYKQSDIWVSGKGGTGGDFNGSHCLTYNNEIYCTN